MPDKKTPGEDVPAGLLPPLAAGVKTIAVFLEKKPYFGATVAHIPFLHLLRRVYPGASLIALSPAASMELLARCGAADKFVRYDWSFSGIRRTIRAIAPDLIFVLRPASRGLDLAVASCRVRGSAAYDSWLGRLLYSRVVPPSGDIYRARKYLALLMDRQAALAAPLDGWFREAAAASSLPALAARTLAVLPGGGSGDFKLWGLGRFIGLCEKLAARDVSLNFLWILGPREAGYLGEIEASGVFSRSRVLLNAPLQDLAAAALVSAGAVGNDCGPAHVFQMCGCPFTCLLSDLDGRGQRCAEEWLDASNGPFAVLSDPGRPITEVKVGTVLAAVLKRLPS
jgi:ADP-heptose:LPS heptosyltransferase